MIDLSLTGSKGVLKYYFNFDRGREVKIINYDYQWEATGELFF